MSDASAEQNSPNLRHTIGEFVQENESYYSKAFAKIQGSTGFTWTFNRAAALLGPLWGALRGAWGFFWIFLVLELAALVQLGRGLWGELGADQLAKYDRLIGNIAKREQQAKDLVAAGDRRGCRGEVEDRGEPKTRRRYRERTGRSRGDRVDHNFVNRPSR